MRWNSRFWLSKVRGWAAGVLVASSAVVGSTSLSFAGESYFIADEQSAASASDVQPVHVPGKEAAPAYAPGYAQPGCNQCDTGCDDCCGRGWPCGCNLADMGEAHKLFDTCWMQERGIVGTGWLAQSYTWNPYQPNDKFNGPMTWTDRANEYQMNELYYSLHKPIDNEGCGWDYGWRVDTLYGTNYRWNTAAGLEENFGNNQFYGLALPQIYGEVAYNDLSVKIGHFVSPVGFYAIGTANNYFPVLPYTFQYGEPFTHSGFLANYKVDEDTNIGGGLTKGWDNFDNSGNPNMGAILTYSKVVNDTDTFAYVGVYGREPNLSGQGFVNGPNLGFSTRYLQTLTYSRKFSDDVTGVLQSDYGEQGRAQPDGSVGRWYGLNSYLYWNQTCQLQWGLNAEWFRDDGGTRVGQVLPSFGSPNARGYARPVGYDGSFYRLMFGPKYYFTPNIYGRTAIAADWYDGRRNRVDNSRPFDDGQRSNQQVVVFDVIATF